MKNVHVFNTTIPRRPKPQSYVELNPDGVPQTESKTLFTIESLSSTFAYHQSHTENGCYTGVNEYKWQTNKVFGCPEATVIYGCRLPVVQKSRYANGTCAVRPNFANFDFGVRLCNGESCNPDPDDEDACYEVEVGSDCFANSLPAEKIAPGEFTREEWEWAGFTCGTHDNVTTCAMDRPARVLNSTTGIQAFNTQCLTKGGKNTTAVNGQCLVKNNTSCVPAVKMCDPLKKVSKPGACDIQPQSLGCDSCVTVGIMQSVRKGDIGKYNDTRMIKISASQSSVEDVAIRRINSFRTCAGGRIARANSSSVASVAELFEDSLNPKALFCCDASCMDQAKKECCLNKNKTSTGKSSSTCQFSYEDGPTIERFGDNHDISNNGFERVLNLRDDLRKMSGEELRGLLRGQEESLEVMEQLRNKFPDI